MESSSWNRGFIASIVHEFLMLGAGVVSALSLLNPRCKNICIIWKFFWLHAIVIFLVSRAAKQCKVAQYELVLFLAMIHREERHERCASLAVDFRGECVWTTNTSLHWWFKAAIANVAGSKTSFNKYCKQSTRSSTAISASTHSATLADSRCWSRYCKFASLFRRGKNVTVRCSSSDRLSLR